MGRAVSIPPGFQHSSIIMCVLRHRKDIVERFFFPRISFICTFPNNTANIDSKLLTLLFSIGIELGFFFFGILAIFIGVLRISTTKNKNCIGIFVIRCASAPTVPTRDAGQGFYFAPRFTRFLDSVNQRNFLCCISKRIFSVVTNRNNRTIFRRNHRRYTIIGASTGWKQ